MKVDNLNLILNLIEFQSEDDFYFLQIIRRRKENPQLKIDSRVIQTYQITSKEQLEEKYEDIKTICNVLNARAYINLNKRSFKQIAFRTLEKITSHLIQEQYKSVARAYESVSGTYTNQLVKRWVIDIDNNHSNVEEILNTINKCRPYNETQKLLAKIPTKSGVHLIVSPFDIEESGLILNVQKDGPTILYIP